MWLVTLASSPGLGAYLILAVIWALFIGAAITPWFRKPVPCLLAVAVMLALFFGMGSSTPTWYRVASGGLAIANLAVLLLPLLRVK